MSARQVRKKRTRKPAREVRKHTHTHMASHCLTPRAAEAGHGEHVLRSALSPPPPAYKACDAQVRDITSEPQLYISTMRVPHEKHVAGKIHHRTSTVMNACVVEPKGHTAVQHTTESRGNCNTRASVCASTHICAQVSWLWVSWVLLLRES